MKSKIRILVVLLVLCISGMIFSTRLSAQQPYVGFQVFYDQLSQYGEWVDYPNYGYVWIPDAGPDFVPYSTMGHWIFTDYGWTWVSQYDWGWAPFHYGRWDYDNYYGWFWIPDNEWGPAWVTWRRSDGYYGWEPMGPGITISLSFGQQYDNHHDHWIFVRDRDIDRPDINHYYIDRNEHERIVSHSKVINNTYVDNRRNTTYVTGPDRADFQKVTGRRVNPVAIQEKSQPGQDMKNGQFRIYRPEVAKNNIHEKSSAPSRLTNLKDVKRPSERKAVSQPMNTGRPENAQKEQQPNSVRRQKNDVKTEQKPVTKPLQKQNIRPVQQQTKKPVEQQNARPVQQIEKPAQKVDIKPVQQQKENPKPVQQHNEKSVEQQNVKPVNQQNARPVQQNEQPVGKQNVKPVRQQKAKQLRNNANVKKTTPVKTVKPDKNTGAEQK